jgi:hypothetical protein
VLLKISIFSLIPDYIRSEDMAARSSKRDAKIRTPYQRLGPCPDTKVYDDQHRKIKGTDCRHKHELYAWKGSWDSRACLISDSICKWVIDVSHLDVQAVPSMTLTSALVKLASGYLQINNYDCIVIFCGTNDFEKACDDKLPTNEIVDLIQCRVNAIINVLRQTVPKTKIAFACILPRPKDDHTPKLNEDLRKVNGAVKTLCKARKVVFLNTYKAVSNKGVLDRKRFGEDGLHLSYKGVKSMIDFFRGATSHLLKDTFTTTGRARYVPFENNPSVSEALEKK